MNSSFLGPEGAAVQKWGMITELGTQGELFIEKAPKIEPESQLLVGNSLPEDKSERPYIYSHSTPNLPRFEKPSLIK